MDTQTFLNKLKELADSYNESQQNTNEIFDYLDTNYEVYINATPEEREKIRWFVKSPSKPKSFFGRLFQFKQENSPIAHLLLIYVKERVLPQLKSTKDSTWLYRGLAAISMDNFTGTYTDQDAPYLGDASLLLADLFVSAEETGIAPETIFKEIADVSSNKSKELSSMKDAMNNAGKTKFAHERRKYGKFVGMF